MVSGRLAEPGAVLHVDNLYWKHPKLEIHAKRVSVGGHGFTRHSGSNLEDMSSCGKLGERIISGSQNDA